MKPTLATLIKQKVKYGVNDNEPYFDVEDLREKYPDLRFPPDKIKQISIGGIIKSGIRAQDLHELTDFEINLTKLYNFKK